MDFDKQVLVFSHIPKNAGASLYSALSSAIGAERCVSLRMQKIESIRSSRMAEIVNGLYSNGRKFAAGLSGRHYLSVSRQNFDAVALIHGHFCIGEEPSTAREPVYISVVRDPVDRFVSYYNYRKDQLPSLMRGRKSHPLLEATGRIPETVMEYLDMLVRRGTLDWRNSQVRYFSPLGTFASAQQCIEANGVYAAPFPRLADFGRVIECDLGIAPIAIRHANRGVSRAREGSTLSCADQERIREFFEEDYRLYQFVSERFALQVGEG